jgi:hypothetical protein
VIVQNASRRSTLVTDESRLYTKVGDEFADHQTLIHSRDEYVNKDGFTTNNVENFFGIFKKGMVGTYHKCEEQHLQRYLNEFAFRYSKRSGLGVTDIERAAALLKSAEASAFCTGDLTRIKRKKQAAQRFAAWQRRKPPQSTTLILLTCAALTPPAPAGFMRGAAESAANGKARPGKVWLPFNRNRPEKHCGVSFYNKRTFMRERPTVKLFRASRTET